MGTKFDESYIIRGFQLTGMIIQTRGVFMKTPVLNNTEQIRLLRLSDP